jgi:hypothetical protein
MIALGTVGVHLPNPAGTPQIAPPKTASCPGAKIPSSKLRVIGPETPACLAYQYRLAETC